MKVNYKQMVPMLKAQVNAMKAVLFPEEVTEAVNEIPENFNQTGWDITIEKLETLLERAKKLREIKGTRLTPQFYRSIYNRCLIAISEADKLIEALTVNSAAVDYEFEFNKLNSEIYELNVLLETKKAEELKAAKEAEERAAKEAEIKAAEDAKAEKSKTVQS